jgi:hypothetical protein
MNYEMCLTRRTPLLVRRGGRDIKKDAATPPLMERMGWWLTDTFRVRDHPVCAAKVASQR